jgi:hypothetical protein
MKQKAIYCNLNTLLILLAFVKHFFMRIFQMTLNINGFVQERKDRTENCGGGWLAYILKGVI